MSDFNIDSYLDTKLGAPANDKVTAVLQARDAKIQQLQQFRNTLAASTNQYLDRKRARQESWVGRLGLDVDSALGRTVDGAAQLFSGVTRTAGEALALTTGDASAAIMDSGLAEDEIQAIGRFKQGNASAADLELINRRPERQEMGALEVGAGDIGLLQLRQATQQMTPLERFEAAAQSRKVSESVRQGSDWSAAIQPDARNALTDQLKDGSQPLLSQVSAGVDRLKLGELGGLIDIAKGSGALALKAGEAAIDNPWGTAGFVLENVPQVGVGALGAAGRTTLALSNAGYASGNYQKGITNFQDANQGAYPDAGTRAEMAAWAAATGLAEHVTDLSILKGAKAAEVAEEAARRSITTRLKNVLVETGKGVATEAATEGFQTYAEGEAQLKPASAQDIYEGAAIGGMAGGGLQGGGRAVSELLTPNPKALKDGAPTQAITEAVVAAQQTGDVESLIDPKAKTYAPAQAIAALERFSAKAGDTARGDALAKAGEIVASLETERDAISEELTQLQAAKAGLAQAKKAGDAATVEQYEAVLQDVDPDGKAEARLQKRNERITALAEQSKETMARFSERATVKAASFDVDEQITTINSSTDQAGNQAMADKIINLSMAAPERVTDAQVSQLLGNEANGLSSAQRTYLRQFTEARAASNKLKDAGQVGKEIYFGGNGNVGLAQYRRTVSAALASGNRQLADRYLSQLASFEASHSSKAALVAEAMAETEATGNTTQVVRNASGAWEINTGPLLDRSAAAKNGAPTIHRKTPKSLVDSIRQEADAITKTLNELTSAVALKFPAQEAQQGGPDVQNVPESREVPAAGGAAGSQVEASQGRSPADPAGGNGRAAGVPGADGSRELQSSGGTSEVDVQASPDAPNAVSSDPAAAVDAVEGQNQSTQEISTNPELDPQGVQAESEERTSETGEPVLSALAEKSEPDAPFNLRNLIADHFTQQGGETAQPLATQADLFSSLLEKMDTLPPAVQGFLKITRSWGQLIRASLPALRKKEQRLYDVTQFLLVEGANGQPDLDENVRTAIALAAFNWVASEATGPRNLQNKSINAILGKEGDARVSAEARELLGQAGTYLHTAADSLGGAVIQALGLKAKANAPLELEPKLRIALGLHALKLAEDAGLLTRTVIDGETMSRLRGSDAVASDLVQHQFVAVAREADGKPVAKAQEIVEAVRGSKGSLDKFFGAVTAKVLPSLQPIKQVQKTTSGTKQGLPRDLEAVIRKNQSNPRVVVQDKLQLFGLFNDDQINALIGIVPVSSELVHKTNRKGLEAKNEGLRREYDNFMEWAGELALEEQGLDTPFYLPFNVWKQQRVGIASNVVNPQTSKIVRFLVGSPEWKTTVDPSNPELMDSFWLRVAEGLGVKVERQDNALSIAQVQKMVAEPAMADAIAALRMAIVDRVEISEDQKNAIVAAVGGDRLHALDVLIGVARFEAANGGPFEVQMMGEVDGVANGTMLNHVLMGAGSQAMLNQGGFFEEGNAHAQYNQWRGTPGNLDVYETTARKLFQKVAELFPAGSPSYPTLEAIWDIAGEIFDETTQKVTKDGRNLIKDALNPLAFGSAMERAVEGMSEAFLAKVYEQFEGLAEADAPQPAVDALVKRVNALIDSPKLHIPLGKPIGWHLDNVLSTAAEKSIQKNFISTVGMAVTEVVGNEFAPFLARRNQLNAMAQASFALYDAVYQGMREAYVAELLAKGELFADDKGLLTDLSKAQEAELSKRLEAVMPVVETSMSQRDQDNTGLLMAKSERVQNKTRPYQNDTKFGTPVKSTGHKSTTLFGISRTTASPGVAMGSAQTHSLDSGISHDTQAEMDVLNIHDAVGAGVGQLGAAARLMNQNTWRALLNYSPLGEQHAALARVIEGISGLVARNELSPQALSNLSVAVRDLSKKMAKLGMPVDPKQPLQSLLMSTKVAAYQADVDKLKLMKTWASVDQYAYQGGNYEVTAEDRTRADEKLQTLSRKPAESALQAAAAIQEALKKKPAKGTAGAVPVTAAQPTAPEDRAEPGTSEEFQEAQGEDTQSSPFGNLGKPAIAADPEILAFFKANPVAKAQDVVRLLNQVLAKQAGPSAGLMKAMLPLLMKTLPASMTVTLITAKTTPEDVRGLPTKTSVGWFVSTAEGQDTAYILSPDFKESALQPEVLLHELVHGALARAIADPSPEAKKLVAELEDLMAEARTHVQRQGLTGFDEALSDVQEFVAYGLSNQAFQRQVLAQISLPSKTDDNTLVQGMRAFIDKVVALVFRGSSKSQQQIAVSGLTVLVQNVSGLFMAANEAKAGGSINLSMAASAGQDYSTLDIHAALNDGSVSPAFSEKLGEVLSQVVQKLHGPFGTFKAALMQNQAQGPLDVWAKAVSSGLAPFAYSVLNSPLKVSQQEAHAMEQVEATLREVLSSPEASARSVYRELAKLYSEMAEVIKPSDFNSQAEYDYVFKVELNSQGRSEHLARFAAFGLANEQVNKLLQRSTAVKIKATKQTFAQRLQSLFERGLEYLQERLTHTFSGQRADEKLKALVYQLVDIEGKKIAALQQRSMLSNVAGPLEAGIKKAADAAIKKVVETAGSPMVRNSKNNFVRAAGSTVRLYANNQVDAFVEAFTQFRNQAWDERLGFIAGTINYAMSGSKVFEALLRERKRIEGQRKDIITGRAKMAREMFANGGKEMTEKESAVITKVFLRTGLHVLADRFDMAGLATLLGDRKALASEIRALEQQLATYGAAIQAHFINKANALGYYAATGETKDPVLMMNAHNIARLYGTPHVGRLSQEQIDSAQAVIEQLVALNALNYSTVGDVQLALAVLTQENQRAAGEGHGVAAVLALHKHMEQESRSRLFQGQEALMIHGYVPDIMNPNTDMQVATAAEGLELEAAGYVKVGSVKKDPADPEQEPRAIYVMRDGGMAPLLTGVVSYSGKAAKGTKKHSGFLNPNTAQGLENASTNADVLSAKPTGLATGAKKDLAKSGENFMVPIVNAQGEIVNWRYMMAGATRDTLMERDNRFDKVMGLMAGSIFDKQTTTETNVKAIEALKEHYDAEGAKHPQSYVLVGPNSPDAEGRETWSMLPRETQEAVRQIWGADGMYVQQTLRDIVFGYRKLSLADAVRNTQQRRKDNAERAAQGLAPLKAKNTLEEAEEGLAALFTATVEYVLRQVAIWKSIPDPDAYAMRAAAKVAGAERMWQELVQETKDLIVVKSISVLVGNVRSNLSLLLLSGVPIKDILRDHLVALRGATAYQKDSEELDRIETMLAAGLAGNDKAKLERQVAMLKDSLARNPVHELIEAGLMPSIVEDTSADDDIYSYKSQLGRVTEKTKKWVHPMVRRAANEIYMGRDTKAYQGLRRFTQLSDFMARYTQYQHLISRAENPLSKADAMQQASDDFVNYDIPMQRTMQYLDDSGIFMFTKYFLRIQKVILRLTKEKPGRVLAAVGLDQFMSLGPIVLDSSWVGRVGNNPLSWGALQYPGSLDELATVSAGMALVK